MLFMPSVSRKIKNLLRVPVFDQKGQSIIIFVFAFLGLIAMLGLALDIGLIYIEQTRIKRAVDAATLAGVVELPYEEKAVLRAINYLDGNGYRLRDNNTGQALINVYIRGCAHDGYLQSTNFGNYHDSAPAPPIRETKQHNNLTFHLYFPSTGPAVDDPDAEFFIDTRSFQSRDTTGAPFEDNQQCYKDADILGTANKIHVDSTVGVGMNFMQFFGRKETSVSDEAIAQNVTSLDVAVVFDMSGSMQFDTTGYGFYEPYGDGTTAWTELDYGHDYPIDTFINRIPTDHLPQTNMTGAGIGVGNNDGQLCWQRDGNLPDYYTVGGGTDTRRYVVIEAELYSLNTSVLAGAYREPGRGYWAVQHTNWRTVLRMTGAGWDPDDSYAVGATPILQTPTYIGSWVSHHPYVEWSIQDVIAFGHSYTLEEVTNPEPENPPFFGSNDVPSLEYDFVTAGDWEGGSNDDTRIWARIQGGGDWGSGRQNIYWAVYRYSDEPAPGTEIGLWGSANGDPTLATPLGSGTIEPIDETPGNNGPDYGGADSNRWTWRELTKGTTSLDLENNTRYILKIWAGRTGYDIDQIVIGNDSSTAFTNNYNGGVTTLQATPGSAFRQACNRCNPIYGRVVDQSDCVPPNDNGSYDTFIVPNGAAGVDLADPGINPLYSGYEPIRGSKEAVKRFIAKMDPQFDQVGLVAYSSGTPAAGRVELRCNRYLPANSCFLGTNPISFTQVLDTLERLPPDGSTNMAEGMLRGLEVLGVDANNVGSGFDNNCSTATSHCGRGGAARRVMIVMSDGVANRNPWDNTGVANQNCRATDLYQPNVGDNNEDRAKDCTIFYGQIAAANNVTIYTIGLGNGVDEDFMRTVAELPGSNGEYFFAPSPAQLDQIFESILQSISVRLIE